MLAESKCWTRGCRHFLGVNQEGGGGELNERYVCKAFPDRIPASIAYGRAKHLRPIKGQGNKIVFEGREEKTPTPKLPNGGWILDDRKVENNPYLDDSSVEKPALLFNPIPNPEPAPELKHFAQPADKSLEAYKRWLTEMFEALGGTGETLTEEKWIAGWKEFWEQAKPEDSPGEK